VEVSTVSGLARATVEAAEGTSRPEGATDSEYWESLLLRACDLAEGRWDTVIVDEAQDFQEAAWFRSRRMDAVLDRRGRGAAGREGPARLQRGSDANRAG
jgi:hypothetical protein